MATWPHVETVQVLPAFAPGCLREREQSIRWLTDLLVLVIERDAQEQRAKAADTADGSQSG